MSHEYYCCVVLPPPLHCIYTPFLSLSCTVDMMSWWSLCSVLPLCACIFLTEPPKPSTLCDPPTLPDFMEHIAFHIQAKWYNFGLMLGVPSDALDCYEHRYRGDQLACLERVFEAWMKVHVPSTELFRWLSIVTALETKVVGEKVLATHILNILAV